MQNNLPFDADKESWILWLSQGGSIIQCFMHLHELDAVKHLFVWNCIPVFSIYPAPNPRFQNQRPAIFFPDTKNPT
jgi:hypothetical protein